MRSDLTRRIRALGYEHNMSNVFSIITSSQVQISAHQGQHRDTLSFLDALGQLLHAEQFEIISIRDDYPHLTIIAQAIHVGHP